MDSRTGELLTYTQCQTGCYFDDIKNPIYFRLQNTTTMATGNKIITLQIRANHNLRKVLGLQICWLNLVVLSVSPRLSGEALLDRFKFHVMKHLNNLGVISINNVIRSINHFIDLFDQRVFYAPSFYYNIKMRLY
ncbi:replication-enhancer protein [Tomato pseudo-curly top virus]|uniref:Replication enhancer protein n=1 Tax=Tomato pseudo-curly top virus TaxID=49267 RepID=REN_TPCTV|nr:replication-enhancer protein [Tomato pseudo-curly top virus]Q88890.1 RecName: Full=Replication enhancer protein; Short=REn; AltName: Full=16.1 kDa protein; AltName: Full=Protein C3; AltName: Full=Protein L3 [Tomato pseudo-curly top virus]CAA59225.1 ORF C3 [Tomato pseudo-curly top virus]